jgi:hypothetical protein
MKTLTVKTVSYYPTNVSVSFKETNLSLSRPFKAFAIDLSNSGVPNHEFSAKMALVGAKVSARFVLKKKGSSYKKQDGTVDKLKKDRLELHESESFLTFELAEKQQELLFKHHLEQSVANSQVNFETEDDNEEEDAFDASLFNEEEEEFSDEFETETEEETAEVEQEKPEQE